MNLIKPHNHVARPHHYIAYMTVTAIKQHNHDWVVTLMNIDSGHNWGWYLFDTCSDGIPATLQVVLTYPWVSPATEEMVSYADIVMCDTGVPPPIPDIEVRDYNRLYLASCQGRPKCVALLVNDSRLHLCFDAVGVLKKSAEVSYVLGPTYWYKKEYDDVFKILWESEKICKLFGLDYILA